MSDDPETARQIAELSRDDRPLLVLDVDDVLLDFIGPFPRYLAALGFDLRLDSFRLTGNIVERATGIPAEAARVTMLIDAFFEAQAQWQTVTEGAARQATGTTSTACLASWPPIALSTPTIGETSE